MSNAGRAAALVCALANALPIQPAAHVAGRVRTEDRRQLVGGTLTMVPIHDETRDKTRVPATPANLRIAPDGTFIIRDVMPGRYEIRARGDVDARGITQFGTFAVEVRDRDVDNIDLVLRPGATAEGTVTFEGGKPPLTGVRVRAPLADGSPFGDAVTGDIKADGSFRIPGMMAGAHVVTIDGLPSPWTVKSVLVSGQDISDATIDVQSGQRVAGVRIAVSRTASEVSGTVKNEQDGPAEGPIVIFVPLAEQYWSPTSRRIGIARADQEGRYRVRGLPPGEYRAVSAFGIDERDAHTTAVLRSISHSGTAVTIDEVRPKVLDLIVVPVETLKRISPR
jgi:hypothetical protein